MHSTTAVLHAQPFTLGYPPSSSASDCIGSQQPPRFFSQSAAFNPGDEDSHGRRIGFLGQSLQDPNTITSPTTGLAYSPRTPGIQDVPFGSSSGGLFMTPTDGTTTESLLSTPGSLYQRSSASWQRGMAGFVSSETRIPSILPAVNPIVSLQGGGHSLGGNTLMARDNNYPNGYHSLSRQTYASPSAPLHDSYRYSYSSGMPQGTGTSLGDPYSLLQSQRGSHSQPEAPPFCVTESIDHIVGSSHQEVTPIIHAKIHKGFFQAENKWTCYRRNYFSVSCSFSLQPLLHHGSYFYQEHDHSRPEPIVKWGMSISAVVNNTENETRELVQHTPKRDRKSEKKPEMVQLRPMPMNSNVVGSGPHSPLYGTAQQMEFNSYGMQQAQPPPSQHTFERIQFQKATANNGKRRAQQQFYNLIVELHVLVGSHLGQQQWKMVARRISEPMVVRGRSPGHYKNERRHSSASMGDSGGRGGSTGGGGGGGGSGDAGRSLMSSSMDHHQQHQQQSYSSSSQMQFLFDSSSQRGDPSHYSHSRDLSRHDSYQNFGQTTNHCVEAISPLVSTSDGSIDFTFHDALASTHESADSAGGGGGMGGNRGLSHMSHYSNRHDIIHGEDEDSCFRRDSGSSGSSCRQSHVPSLDLSSSSGTLDDAFDPMIVSYPSGEHEDASEQYSKQSTAERCLLTSIVNDNNTQCAGNNHNSSLTAGAGSGGAVRSSGTSFSRLIDPSQESLCV